MEKIFWFFIGLTGFIYFGYPVTIYLLAQLFGKEPQRGGIAPLVSLIIAAHDEERIIAKKVKNTLELDYPADKLEIIFALDGCKDRTKQILLEFINNRIKILDNPDRAGKVAVLNQAVKQATGEIVLLSDANSIYHPETISKIIRNFADPKVGCVSGRLCYTQTDSTSVGKGENLYWRYETFLKKQESRLGKLLITNGSIQAVRKNIYPYPDPEVADDFSIPLLIQANRYKVIYEPEAVVYEVATQSIKEELEQKIRILAQGFKGVRRLGGTFLSLSPLGIFELLFHKLLRWWVGLYLIFIFLINLTLLNQHFYVISLAVQIVFYGLALIGFLLRQQSKIKIFYIPFYFCLVNFAALIALWRFIRKDQTSFWDKASSTRIEK